MFKKTFYFVISETFQVQAEHNIIEVLKRRVAWEGRGITDSIAMWICTASVARRLMSRKILPGKYSKEVF